MSHYETATRDELLARIQHLENLLQVKNKGNSNNNTTPSPDKSSITSRASNISAGNTAAVEAAAVEAAAVEAAGIAEDGGSTGSVQGARVRLTIDTSSPVEDGDDGSPQVMIDTLTAENERLKHLLKDYTGNYDEFVRKKIAGTPQSHTSSIATLGEGSFGKVFMATGGIDKQQVAIKEIVVQADTPESFTELFEKKMTEVYMHARLPPHEHVVQYKHVIVWKDEPDGSGPKKHVALKFAPSPTANVSPPSTVQGGCDSVSPMNQEVQEVVNNEGLCSPISSSSHILYHAKLLVVMQYCNAGTLESFRDRRPAPGHRQCLAFLKKALPIFSDAVSGVSALHQNNILHCDIKPANILLNRENMKTVAKIADFGMCRNIDCERSPGGTEEYMSPEQRRAQLRGAKSDVYSLGIVLFELVDEEFSLNRTANWTDSAIWVDFQKSKNVPARWTASFGKFQGADKLFRLVKSMTKSESSKRLDLEEVQNSLKSLIKKSAEWAV